MGPTLGDIALGLLPMVVLVAAWAFFMWQWRRKGGPQSRALEMQQRQVEALERIAKALENRR